MAHPDSPFEPKVLRILKPAAALGFILLLAACGDRKKDDVDAPAPAPEREAQAPPSKTPEPAVARQPDVPPLAASSLDRVARQCALIRAGGQPDQQGVLLRGGSAPAGGSEYYIICSLPSGPDRVDFACQASDGLFVSSAKKSSDLPGGLFVYAFTSNKSLNGYRPVEPSSSGPMYAIRIEGSGAISDAERESITGKLASLRERMETLQPERGRPPGGRVSSREDFFNMRREEQSRMREKSDLFFEIAGLEKRLTMDVDSLAGKQVAAAASEQDLERHASELSDTLLVTGSSGLCALRHQGEWVMLKEVLETASGDPSKAGLQITGSKSQVNLTCSIDWGLPFGKAECSLVAATTFELESIAGTSIEDRLSKVKPEAMRTGGSKLTAYKTLQWNGEPTTLWIRVFQDGKPDQPIIDETVLIDYADRFSAKWGKAPSPLIEIPEPEPDLPPDLAGERTTLDARGTILDLVAAGDGSILMVQTDKAPFWTPLDLKTGRFTEAKWKAGPDTILCAQAGKVYLIDRKTKVVEIWNLESMTRSGLQILPLDGEVVAAAAPLSAPDAPLLISTDAEARFIDPVEFEVITNGFDAGSMFSSDEKRRGPLPRLDPKSLHLRASGDGALYTIIGDPIPSRSQSRTTLHVMVDPSSAVRMANYSAPLLAARGRQLTEYFPDHGGSIIQVQTVMATGSFPGPPGTIRFMDRKSNRTLAELRSVPVVPAEFRYAKGPLAADRGLYFDSSLGVLVLPDEEKIHVIPIHIEEQPDAVPEFLFAGEEVEIPLPQGSGHKLESNVGGETMAGDSSIKWKVPADGNRSQANLKLEWTGELGTTLNASYTYNIVYRTPGVTVESRDGKTRLPLKRTGILTGSGGFKGFAGSGNVILMSSGSEQTAWSLTTCELLFSSEERSRGFFGDADQLYLVTDSGTLKAFDILTGSLVGETTFGKPGDSSGGLAGITTGISSREPLLAVEKDGMNRFLELVDRRTLKTKLLNFSPESQRLFFNTHFETNPSGSVTWSFTAAVFRDGREITAKSYQSTPMNGVPDASGRYVVGRDGILDIRADPPVKTLFSSLPGVKDLGSIDLDVSGRYLVCSDHDSSSNLLTASIRDLRSPAVELFKITVPATSGVMKPRVISAVGKLVFPLDYSSGQQAVFEFDIPAIMKQLAVRGANP